MTYEIELKSLLGGRDAADALRAKLLERQAQLVEQSKQLNHYFMGSALPSLATRMTSHLSPRDAALLDSITVAARSASVRTRLLNDAVLLIVKAAVDDTTSENGIQRREFEALVTTLDLNALDNEVVAAGYQVQARWSRERDAYQLADGTVVCIDRNAGYGYLAEFERVVDDADRAAEVEAELRRLMAELDCEELAQDRLERMFAHYNANWPDYYGTDRTFVIE
ncbi:MAG: CYTH domain-containing protein [Chloroflexi bacterium]|nr:CYTH domain-containing protein [Chloroflexota bacterium]